MPVQIELNPVDGMEILAVIDNLLDPLLSSTDEGQRI
jgi:hypothetical protein